jgi:hypothetical protein
MSKKRGGLLYTIKKSIKKIDKVAPKIINQIHF